MGELDNDVVVFFLDGLDEGPDDGEGDVVGAGSDFLFLLNLLFLFGAGRYRSEGGIGLIGFGGEGGLD